MKNNSVSVERDWAGSVRVISAAWDGVFNFAGRDVATVQEALAYPFGIPRTARAFVNGIAVEPSYRLQPNDTLEFVLPCGEKSILDPDEKAQLKRIEEMMARLVSDPPKHTKDVAARRGLPGRRSETLEIAEYANDLRLQGKTWKEVLSGCKKHWPDDRRVRNVGQIRATWTRHFGPPKKSALNALCK